MVEIEVTKRHQEYKKRRELVSQIKWLKIKGYKVDCGHNGSDIKVILDSFRKRFTFIFIKTEKGYGLITRKITPECLLLSKVIEKFTGSDVKIQVSNNKPDDEGDSLLTQKEARRKARLAKGRVEGKGELFLYSFAVFFMSGILSMILLCVCFIPFIPLSYLWLVFVLTILAGIGYTLYAFSYEYNQLFTGRW